MQTEIEISQSQFERYKKVQKGGRVNMIDWKSVSALSDLDKSQIISIMKNYDSLSKKYPEVNK